MDGWEGDLEEGEAGIEVISVFGRTGRFPKGWIKRRLERDYRFAHLVK